MRIFAALLLALALSPAAAATPTPDSVARKVSSEMLAAARQGLTEAAVARLSTYFDFARMTPFVLGSAWQRATPSQQVQLRGEFQRVALRTYAGLLANTPDSALEFAPAPKPAADESEVTVHAQVRHGNDPVRIDYLLGRTEEGWKIYDLRVGGASFAATWRSEFAAEIREHGIDGLIGALGARNRKAAAAAL